jgi:aryl-alcohol dehydrogenase-like predicted oxidoreductase
MHTLSQAAMVFCLMNQEIATTVPGVKNVAEIEELAACVALPPIPPAHLTRLRALYARGFPGESTPR